jgi:hypothetical protein
MGQHPRSGQVVPLRRGATDSGRTSPRSARPNHSRPAPRPLSTCRTEKPSADVGTRTVTAGDAAQARRFVQMLQTELVQLQRRLAHLGRDQRMRDEVSELTVRTAELQRLVAALSARFGEPPTVAATVVRRDRFIPAAASRN